jgi:hypothetical protein
VGVDVERQLDGRVAQPLADHLDGDAGFETAWRECVYVMNLIVGTGAARTKLAELATRHRRGGCA